MSHGARGQGRRRRLTWSAYPRRFLADVFKKFRHGRKDFSSGCSPRAGTDSRSEVAVGTQTQSPQKAARSAARAQQLGRHCPRLPPHRPEPHAAGSAAGRHPGALGLPPPGRAHVSLPTSSPPPNHHGTAADRPSARLSHFRFQLALARSPARPRGLYPRPLPPRPSVTRRAASGAVSGSANFPPRQETISAELGPGRLPPNPARSPPGARLPPPRRKGRGRARGGARSAELPPAAAPLPPPPPPEGSRPGGRPIPGRSEAAAPAIGERRAGSRRRARRSGGRKRREARGTEVGAALTGQASPAASCGPRTITKLCPKWLPGPARPGAGGGGACERGGRGRESEGIRPVGSAGGHAERPPHPRRPPSPAGRRVRARPPAPPISVVLAASGAPRTTTSPRRPRAEPSRAAGQPGSRLPARRPAPVRVRKLRKSRRRAGSGQPRSPQPSGRAQPGCQAARRLRSARCPSSTCRAAHCVPRTAALFPCSGTRGAVPVPARTAEAAPSRSAPRCAGSAAARPSSRPALQCQLPERLAAEYPVVGK